MKDENSKAKLETDLLGDPVEVRHEIIGASDLQKEEKNQLLTNTLRTRWWSQDRSARLIGGNPKTLRKHFSRKQSQASDIL